MKHSENNNKGNLNLIVCSIIAIITVLLLTSCGARKVDKSKTQTKEVITTETTFKDSSKTVTKVDSNIKIIDTSTSDEITIQAKDSTKEFIVNGKKYFNVVLRHKKVKNNITTNKIENVSKITQLDVKKGNKSNKVKTFNVEKKQSDKKQFNFLSLWWLILLIPILYFGYRKFKGLSLV